MLKVVERLATDADQVVGADTILKVYGPIVERRVEALVRSIIAAPDESLPELRGRLAEVWSFLVELRHLAEKRQSVDETFNKLFGSGNTTPD
jgi:hypothetical protein